MKAYIQPIIFISAIILGALTSQAAPFSDVFVDISIIVLLFVVFYALTPLSVRVIAEHKKYFSLAWVLNFIVVPTLAFALVALFLDPASLVAVGMIIYLVAPCTDWVLGFTKLARGDVHLNTALLPINLLSQIVLLPVYLWLFAQTAVPIVWGEFFETLLYWIVLPFIAARILSFFTRNRSWHVRVMDRIDYLVVAAIGVLIFFLFNANTDVVLAHLDQLGIVFALILVFFVVMYALVYGVSKLFSLPLAQEVSLSMTTAARNAPLMLGISMLLFPDQPLIHAVLVIGMLVEFPHLITLTAVLKRRAR